MSRRLVLLISLALTCAAQPAPAQDTREAQIAAEQAEKAARLHPYVPSSAERILVRVNRALTETPNGFYPSFGSIYSGGGFALGAGYRRFYGDRAIWNVQGLLSVKTYKSIEISTSAPGHATGRVDLSAEAGWRDATQVAFYGLGPETSTAGRSNFRLKESYATGLVRARPVRRTLIGASLSYEDFTVADGLGGSPSTTAAYSSQSAPGLSANPAYIHSTATAALDWRPAAGYARRGGLYELQYHNYRDRSAAYSFDRVDGRAVQHVPILRETWVVSLRAEAQSILRDSDAVPFFLLPSLGSGSTLRGFTSWRFRDRHSMLVSAEWRWIPNLLGLDMAIFYDAGKVAARRQDLSFDHLESDVGIGARFHGPGATALRIEVARSREGTRLVFSGGPAF